MKLVADVMDAPIWLCPDHTVQMALAIMKGLSTEMIAVVESGAYLGTVDWKDLMDAKPEDALLRVMRKDAPYLEPKVSVKEAAEVLAQVKSTMLPVVENGTLVGVLRAVNLLTEVGRSEDPLTGLPWSDSLREWALAKFRSGKELSILFFDLDDFGQFNKRLGHLVGDQVLQSVADALREGINRDLDFLCRYGGDEFAIATLRRAEAASALASDLAHAIASVRIPGTEERITASWGCFGGKRDREREDVHYAATLDALINQASRNCQAMKEHKKAKTKAESLVEMAGGAGAVADGPIQLRSLNVTVGEGDCTVAVELRIKESLFSASLAGPPDRPGVLKTVAQAVADAISHALPSDCTMVVHECSEAATREGHRMVCVSSTLYAGDTMRELVGSHEVESDVHRAVALATIGSAQGVVGRDEDTADVEEPNEST